jgi:hypothetical protein
MEKVLKNHFFNKFHGIFRGKSLSMEKNVRKIGPWSTCPGGNYPAPNYP